MNPSVLLRRAILVDPSDDVARLAYADCLEEEGDTVWAHLMRESLALHATGLSQCLLGGSCGGCVFCKHYLGAEQAFLQAEPVLRSDLQRALLGAIQPWLWKLTTVLPFALGAASRRETCVWVHRGMIAGVYLQSLPDLEYFLQRLVEAHPIEWVRVMDLQPAPTYSFEMQDPPWPWYVWARPGSGRPWMSILHDESTWNRLRGGEILSQWAEEWLYRTEEEAYADWSDSMLNPVRERAGLPPLPCRGG